MTQSYNLSQLANNLNSAGQLDATDGLSGAVPAANGGTGQSGYTTGDILYASGATALAKLSDVATGNVLISGGVGLSPSWGKVGLTTHIAGTLAVANGGTGAATIPANALVVGAGTSAVTTIAPGTSGNLLLSNGTTWAASQNINYVVGQAWTDLTASRAYGTTYTNSTGRPIFVSAYISLNTGTPQGDFYIDGNLIASDLRYAPTTRQWIITMGGIVPNGSTYLINGGGTLNKWWELR